MPVVIAERLAVNERVDVVGNTEKIYRPSFYPSPPQVSMSRPVVDEVAAPAAEECPGGAFLCQSSCEKVRGNDVLFRFVVGKTGQIVVEKIDHERVYISRG